MEIINIIEKIATIFENAKEKHLIESDLNIIYLDPFHYIDVLDNVFFADNSNLHYIEDSFSVFYKDIKIEQRDFLTKGEIDLLGYEYSFLFEIFESIFSFILTNEKEPNELFVDLDYIEYKGYNMKKIQHILNELLDYKIIVEKSKFLDYNVTVEKSNGYELNHITPAYSYLKEEKIKDIIKENCDKAKENLKEKTEKEKYIDWLLNDEDAILDAMEYVEDHDKEMDEDFIYFCRENEFKRWLKKMGKEYDE